MVTPRAYVRSAWRLIHVIRGWRGSAPAGAYTQGGDGNKYESLGITSAAGAYQTTAGGISNIGQSVAALRFQWSLV